MKLEHLSLSWTTSRGQDTYGYNICRLDSRTKRYKCSGGGYDMVGTVFGMWLNAEHQERLKKLFSDRPVEDCKYQVPGYNKIPGLYGITLSPKGEAHCDGGCGINSMISIAEAIGIEVQTTGNRKGRTDGFIVSWEAV